MSVTIKAYQISRELIELGIIVINKFSCMSLHFSFSEYLYGIYYDSMFRYAIYLVLCLYIFLEIVTTSVMKILRLLYALVSSIYHKR